MSDLARGIDVFKDPSSRATLGITYAHAAVHRDIIVNVTDYVATASGRTYLFRTGTPLQMHFEFRIIADKACTIKLYESPTVTAAGTQLTTRRLDRTSTKTSQMLVYHTPTTSALGTLIMNGYNGGGGQGAGAFGGSLIHADAEWLFKMNTDYLIVVADGSSLSFMLEAEWYEVAEIKR